MQIDADAQVIDMNGKLIPGFCVSGEATGGAHGGKRLGGNAVADVVVFGHMAGTDAAA